MKHFRFLTLSLLAAVSAPAAADDFLCSYTARISDADKTNSQGVWLTAQGIHARTVAALLRQDRANYYLYPEYRDAEDEGDCVLGSRQQRARLERMVQGGSVSPEAARAIVRGNPLVDVDLYEHHVDVRIHREPRTRSTVR